MTVVTGPTPAVKDVSLEATISVLFERVDEMERNLNITLDRLGIVPIGCDEHATAETPQSNRPIQRSIDRLNNAIRQLHLYATWINQINDGLEIL